MWRYAIFGVFVLGIPGAVQANELTFSFGGTVASEYVSSGVYYADGLAIQPYVELGYGGFYAGAYAANTSGVLTGYTAEYGLSLGYRGEAGPVNYDIGVAYYIFDEVAGFSTPDYPEYIVSAYVAATESFYLTGRVAFAPEYDSTNLRLRLDYYTPVAGLSVGAAVGFADTNYGDWEYWTIDATYAVIDNVSLGLGYHGSNYNANVGGTNGTDGGLVVASTLWRSKLHRRAG
ncbi:MAG: hypothetical protein FJX28_09475 [Alphaproteobacteria bacterium]|nr:hypothetical protein [Alphaproteobacteria bacterium]